MLIFTAIFLTLIYVFFCFCGRKDIFSPAFIFNAFAWLKNIPYFYQIGDEYTSNQINEYFFIILITCICVNSGIITLKNIYCKRIFVYEDKITNNGILLSKCFKYLFFL